MKYVSKALPLVLAFLLGVGAVGLYRTYQLQKWHNGSVAKYLEINEGLGFAPCQYTVPLEPNHPTNDIFSKWLVCVDGTTLGIPKVY